MMNYFEGQKAVASYTAEELHLGLATARENLTIAQRVGAGQGTIRAMQEAIEELEAEIATRKAGGVAILEDADTEEDEILEEDENMIYIAKDTIQGTKEKKACGNRAIVRFERVKNDLYGNPLYRVYPVNYYFKPVTGVYKNYASKGYYLLQSYDIVGDLRDLLKQADKFLSVDLDKSLLYGYKKV